MPSPLVRLHDARLGDVRLVLKRDDLIHPDLPGNKWRKLKHNIPAAQAMGTLLTFGGAYSNHIRATATAGRLYGFRTIGVIRGEEHLPLNPVLTYAVEQGMTLTYLDRETYRRKTSPEVVADLRNRFGEFFLLPEGGSNAEAVRGCSEVPAEIDFDFDVIACACGTGGTLAGLSAGLKGQRALGFSVLKGGFLTAEVARLQQAALGTVRRNWTVNDEFHFGGYARRTTALDGFIADFRDRHGLALDWVYVAKMLFGLYALTARGAFAAGTTVVAVVTGSGEWDSRPAAHNSQG
ncbi:pyridoxal-phosphate dependent enzyme [Actinocrispum sp. NPDC049592]|uniref:1-aminocyclopropane-1-carboxylate deaminase/D-cysteine desulfhydrase n=1 Tax=Actinocrispum sp. NPDC049592 TaxID=3154835 RepID=UPI0034248F1A